MRPTPASSQNLSPLVPSGAEAVVVATPPQTQAQTQAEVIAPVLTPSGADGVYVNDAVVSVAEIATVVVPATPQAAAAQDSGEERDHLDASNIFASHDPLGDGEEDVVGVPLVADKDNDLSSAEVMLIFNSSSKSICRFILWL